MNVFNFSYQEATGAIFLWFAYGVFFGFFWGFIRFVLFTAFERKEA